MATYNGAKYVAFQIKSILIQLGPTDELVIQDDASKDTTVDIIESIDDKRIKLKVNHKNVGYIRNFELALTRSCGDYILLSDQDDIWPQNRLEICLREIDGFQIFIGDAKIINEDGLTIADSYFNIRGGMTNSRIMNIFKARYLGCCICIDKVALRKIIPFPNKFYRIPHDYWIGTYGFMFLKHKIIQEPITLYRRHSSNVSDGGSRARFNPLFQIYYRFFTIIFACTRYFLTRNV